jgi:photosystem II stability/assembly factor-like uncharacterized protein
MKIKVLVTFLLLAGLSSVAQNGWTVCNAPASSSRIDDLFMVNTRIGYAVVGNGSILKTTDEGENWTSLLQDNSVYCRSVEFINTQKGFVGAFPNFGTTGNILRRTTDGGATWTDITSLLHPKARKGICGLAVADSNTIYGGGNWYQDSGYIIKSIDGGASWSFIDMSAYASSIIDLHFVSKDTGFATGKSPLSLELAVILYTTDGGATWATKYYGGLQDYGYCWKIQQLTPRIYYASVERMTNQGAKILRSVDGGMTWETINVSPLQYQVQAAGFIDPQKGWVGGDFGKSWETSNGGRTWDSIAVCPRMNRVFKVNDTMLFATGTQIWKYKGKGIFPAIPPSSNASMKCHPNPVKDLLTINIAVSVPAHISLLLLDVNGRRIKVIDNTDRPKGSYQFYVTTTGLPTGIYYVALTTHEDQLVNAIMVTR